MEVLEKEEKILSKEEAAEFYKQHEGSEHFDQLVEFMSRYCKTRTLLWDLHWPLVSQKSFCFLVMKKHLKIIVLEERIMLLERSETSLR